MLISPRMTTAALIACAIALPNVAFAGKTYPPGGNVTGLSASASTISVGETIHFNITGTGKCGIQLFGFPNAIAANLKTSGSLPLSITTSALNQAGTFTIYVETVKEPTDPMWCTGTASLPITVKPALPQAAAKQGVGPAQSITPAGSLAGSVIGNIAGPKLTVSDAIGVYNTIVKLKVHVSNGGDGTPLPNTLVTFKVNGAIAGNTTSAADGSAQIEYKIPESLPAGSNAIEASAGIGSAKGNLDVLKAATTLTLDIDFPASGMVEVGNDVTFHGYLKLAGQNSNGLKGKTVRVNFDNKHIGNAITDASGFYTLKYKTASTGNHSVQTAFDGDAQNLPTGIDNPPHFNVLPTGAKLPLAATITPKQTFKGIYSVPAPQITTPTQIFIGTY